jgi:hypothetical protein
MPGLVTTRETEIIVVSIYGDMFIVPVGKFLNGFFDVLHTSKFPHSLGGKVGVATSTIPLALERLGVEGDLDTPLLGNTNKKISGHPEVITHSDTFTWPNLELPLGRHHFSIDTADVDASIEAGTIVCLY